MALDVLTLSSTLRDVLERLEKIAATNLPVLLRGETGVGKEVIARAIHHASHQKMGKFVAINCAGIPETLLEADLFGYEKGAFTGAAQTKKGRIEDAEGGTVFLDEIGDMPMVLQAKLLRVVDNGVVVRVGGVDEIQIRVRYISSTNVALEAAIKNKMFRLDLYHRLDGETAWIPPLRERPEDIEALAMYFDPDMPGASPHMRFTEEASLWLQKQPWPGNARELQFAIIRGRAYAEERPITIDDLKRGVSPTGEIEERLIKDIPTQELRQIDWTAYTERIREALIRHGGNRARVARELGVSEPTICRHGKDLGIATSRPTRNSTNRTKGGLS